MKSYFNLEIDPLGGTIKILLRHTPEYKLGKAMPVISLWYSCEWEIGDKTNHNVLRTASMSVCIGILIIYGFKATRNCTVNAGSLCPVHVYRLLEVILGPPLRPNVTLSRL